MVTTNFKGGMGNQMFQYAFGRIIAEHKGHKLAISNPDNRKELFTNFPNAGAVEGKETGHNLLQLTPDLQYLNLEQALNHDGAIYLHGYWQKHYYYTPYEDRIRQWFAYDDSQHEKPDPSDLVVHMRLGDQLKPEPIGLPPTVDVYVDLIKQIAPQRCILISDEPDEPFIAPIRALPNVVVRRGSQMEDFSMLKHAKRAIISQSTFAWWATFLGNLDTIYVPLTSSGRRCLWKKCPAVQDIDLIPLTNRYIPFSI